MDNFKDIVNSLPEDRILHFYMRDKETIQDTYLMMMAEENIATGTEQLVI